MAAALAAPVRQVLFTFGVLQHVQAGHADALVSYTDQLAPGCRLLITEQVRHTLRDLFGGEVGSRSSRHVMRAFTLPEVHLSAQLVGLRVMDTATGYRPPSARADHPRVGTRYLMDLRP
ncbi:hypothetical protein [Frankia sp. Cr1]|uniref:hypothetical protein n=1 Tax=Frankia sp. Cr1 TaxID=3073931 RepID=UPI002AD465AD|nr:hypothetical protein [Frankia sp. Cr1]